MNWSQDLINSVWQKAAYVDPTNERNGFRKDVCGAWIKRDAHGNRTSLYGWEIDHIVPQSRGGTEDQKKSSSSALGEQCGSI